MVEARIEHKDRCSRERRYYITSRRLQADEFAAGVREHWAIENNLHWSLDVTFKEDQSRLRAGHGAKNMAIVRHLALNLVRQLDDKVSIKRRRKKASYDPQIPSENLAANHPLASTRSPEIRGEFAEWNGNCELCLDLKSHAMNGKRSAVSSRHPANFEAGALETAFEIDHKFLHGAHKVWIFQAHHIHQTGVASGIALQTGAGFAFFAERLKFTLHILYPLLGGGKIDAVNIAGENQKTDVCADQDGRRQMKQLEPEQQSDHHRHHEENRMDRNFFNGPEAEKMANRKYRERGTMGQTAS